MPGALLGIVHSSPGGRWLPTSPRFHGDLYGTARTCSVDGSSLCNAPVWCVGFTPWCTALGDRASLQLGRRLHLGFVLVCSVGSKQVCHVGPFHVGPFATSCWLAPATISASLQMPANLAGQRQQDVLIARVQNSAATRWPPGCRGEAGHDRPAELFAFWHG